MSDRGDAGLVKGVCVFLLLTFGLAWGSWALLLPRSATADLGLFQLYAMPGAFAPAIASFVVRKWVTREGFADAGLALHPDKWRYYLIAWLLPFPVIACIIAGAGISGIGHPDYSMAAGLAAVQPHARVTPALSGILAWAIPLQVMFAAIVATPFLFGEEFGWRGYLQLRLFARWPNLAAILTGLIWGLWHLPLILRDYEFMGSLATVTAAFCVGTVLLSIIFGWLRRQSGSVWVTSLAHSATNSIGASLTMLLFPNRSAGLYLHYLGVMSWIPLGLLCAWLIARDAVMYRDRIPPP